MRALAKLRQTPWVAGALLLVLAAGIAAPLGHALGLRSWPFYVGLVVAALLLMGWVERLWKRRPLPLPPRTQGKFKVLRGGKGYDINKKDDSTDNPRWLM